MKFMLSILILVSAFISQANAENAPFECKLDPKAKFTATADGNLIIDDNLDAQILFAKIDLYSVKNGKYTKTSSNVINADDPYNNAPELSGSIEESVNDQTYGNFKVVNSKKFISFNVQCSTSDYSQTTFKLDNGLTYSMLCTCPEEI